MFRAAQSRTRACTHAQRHTDTRMRMPVHAHTRACTHARTHARPLEGRGRRRRSPHSGSPEVASCWRGLLSFRFQSCPSAGLTRGSPSDSALLRARGPGPQQADQAASTRTGAGQVAEARVRMRWTLRSSSPPSPHAPQACDGRVPNARPDLRLRSVAASWISAEPAAPPRRTKTLIGRGSTLRGTSSAP